MEVNLSPAMITTLFDILANADPAQLEVEHTHGDDIVTGQDALKFISKLHNKVTADLDVE
jgi:hypothetical protein